MPSLAQSTDNPASRASRAGLGRPRVALEQTSSDAQSTRRALTIFGQLCSALAALHSRGLLHLDVKPANVLLTEQRADHVYLMDYGLMEVGSTPSGDFFTGTPNRS